MHRLLFLAVALVAAACSPPAPPAAPEPVAPAAAPTPAPDPWVGRWIGVEGTYLEVTPAVAAGAYAITEGTLDGVVQFEGRATGDTIAFTRAGAPMTIRKGDGAATGLKYLEGKKDCLVIAEGEGFCRD